MSPVFNYDRYTNPYVQSISALLQQPGEIEAQRAQMIGNAQANAAIGSGQAWGNAIQGAGQAISQIPQQIEAQKLKAAQLADIKGQIAERNAAAAEKQQHLAAMAAGEAAIKSAVDPVTGKIDYDKAVESWTKAGFPTQANAYRESLQKTDQTAQQLQEGQQKIQAGQRQVQQAAANHLGELGAAGLQKIQSGASPLQVRDYTMGLVANAVSHGLIQPDAAKQMLMQSAQASPDQLAGIYQKLLDGAPDVKSRLVAEDLKKAETAKNLAEAQKALNPTAKSYQKSSVLLDGKPAEVLTDPTPGGKIYDLSGKVIDNPARRIQPYVAPEKGEKAPDQNKLEQQYRTVLMREVSSRSGTLGTEDAKVAGANHLLTMFHQSYDPKTGDYNIPKSQQTELALGLARLMSPSGQIGVQLEQEINQATAKGDLNKALTYITGTPFNGSTQAIFKMFRDSIQRQGQTAAENRQAAIKYLQGLAPTELEPARRDALEANTLVPLRQSRLVRNPKTGEQALEVSIDGGKTWK